MHAAKVRYPSKINAKIVLKITWFEPLHSLTDLLLNWCQESEQHSQTMNVHWRSVPTLKVVRHTSRPRSEDITTQRTASKKTYTLFNLIRKLSQFQTMFEENWYM